MISLSLRESDRILQLLRGDHVELLPMPAAALELRYGDEIDGIVVENSETANYSCVLLEWIRCWSQETRDFLILDRAIGGIPESIYSLCVLRFNLFVRENPILSKTEFIQTEVVMTKNVKTGPTF